MAKTFKKIQVFEPSTDFAAATRVVEVPLTPPAEGQVLVKNLYAGVNATDINISAARYFTDGIVPFNIGIEGLGVVESIGAGVAGLTVGQTVIYLGNQGYSEYLYASPAELTPVPDARPEYLATLVNGLTASIALDKTGQIKAGEKVLITAAAGGTGQIAVQWAKSKGCYVIGTTSSDEKGEYLKSLGVDKVINYRTEDLDTVLKRDFPEGIDVVWETIGGTVFETLLSHLAPLGRLVVIGAITGYKGSSGSTARVDPRQFIMKQTVLTGFLLFNAKPHFAEYLPKLITGVANGTLKVAVDLGDESEGGRFKGVEQSPRAVEHLHSGKSKGKVVVQIA